MNSPESILNFILGIQIWDMAKIFACFVFFLYLVFAFVVLRQVNLMATTLNVPVDLPIKTFTWLLFGLAIFAFLLALIIL